MHQYPELKGRGFEIVQGTHISVDPRFSNTWTGVEGKYRDAIMRLLEADSQEKDAVIYWIDWAQHSICIELHSAIHMPVDKTCLARRWMDGLILDDLDKIKKKVGITLLTADCAPISVVTKDGVRWSKIWGLTHAGHMGVAKWIVTNLVELLKSKLGISSYKFHIWPMAWADYEFGISDYYDKFKNILAEYSLQARDYFSQINWLTIWYFDLRKLIIDILVAEWVKKEDIHVMRMDTTDKHSPTYSFRLYTKYNKLLDAHWKTIKTDDEMTEVERRLVENGKLLEYKGDGRLATSITFTPLSSSSQ